MGVGYVQGDRTYVLRTDVGTYDVRIVEGSVVLPQPCESCGAAVIPVMVRDRSDLNPNGPERRTWWELTWDTWTARGERTPAQCRQNRRQQ